MEIYFISGRCAFYEESAVELLFERTFFYKENIFYFLESLMHKALD